MKSVLLSIQPKWCELIASGKKTIEIRKTKPKIETPFKCYIYCTINGTPARERDRNVFTDLRGKVIGEFICDKVECFTTDYRRNEEQTARIADKSCLSRIELAEYEENAPCLYAFRISDLVIYDKPKGLGNFNHCGVNYHFNPPVMKPPQSWCYVEEI